MFSSNVSICDRISNPLWNWMSVVSSLVRGPHQYVSWLRLEQCGHLNSQTNAHPPSGVWSGGKRPHQTLNKKRNSVWSSFSKLSMRVTMKIHRARTGHAYPLCLITKRYVVCVCILYRVYNFLCLSLPLTPSPSVAVAIATLAHLLQTVAARGGGGGGGEGEEGGRGGRRACQKGGKVGRDGGRGLTKS